MKSTSSPVSVPEAGLETPVRARFQHVVITLDTTHGRCLLNSDISSQMMKKKPGFGSWFGFTPQRTENTTNGYENELVEDLKLIVM